MKLIYDVDNCNDLIDTNLLQIIADKCQIEEGIEQECYINILFTDNDGIKILNKNMRGLDSSTDVLSFPSINIKNSTLGDNILMIEATYDVDNSCYFIGDIAISVEQAKIQAKEFGHSYKREIAYLLTHSILHLFGYDHIDENDKREMRKMEEKILKSLNISRDDNGEVSNETLINLAIKAMDRAYVPYSNFPVGACLLSADGRIFQGCNIENAAYGVTMCAERTALFKAVSEGAREFTKIAVVGKNTKAFPCGSCRQALNEFAPNIVVLVGDKTGDFVETTLNELLPNSFGPKSLI